MKPVIIAVAITGSVPRKRDNPAVPITPAEQIESIHEAFEAGASLVHIHVRNSDESPSSDPALFAQVQKGVRALCPGIIVQFSTGARGRDPAARGSALFLKPDMASLATGSVNFPTIIYENSATFVKALAAQLQEHRVLPEIEVFDLSHIHGARKLVDLGLINDRPHVQFVMGIKNALPAAPEVLIKGSFPKLATTRTVSPPLTSLIVAFQPSIAHAADPSPDRSSSENLASPSKMPWWRPCHFQSTLVSPTSWRQCGRLSTGFCDVLQLSCDREDPLTEVVIRKIGELAKAGERDPEIRCFTVLSELDMPLQEAIPRSSPKAEESVVSTEASYA
jgi:hypothetical protein